MRGVADTNTVVSGLLWQGTPRQILDAARAAVLSLYTSAELLAEVEAVVARPKFAVRLQAAGVTCQELIRGYAALVTLVRPASISPVIAADPDDDAVLACAIAAQAEVIVSGDSHLLALRVYQNI